MEWFGARIDGPMVTVRAIHFAATAVMAGSLMFRAVVAAPVLPSDRAAAGLLQTQTLQAGWIGLATTLASGVIWLQLQAMSMSGLPFHEAMASNVLLTVMNRTQFGLVSELRLVLALALAVCLTYDRLALSRWLGLVSALGLTAAIAWTGHAASTMGETGFLHLTADVLHVIAAAAWTGGLVALVRLMAVMRLHPGLAHFARDVILRFSTLGIASVGTLLLSGTVNSWILAGSFHALAVTEYGRLLMLKIGLFAVMVAFAAVNRFRVTPQLAQTEPRLDVLDQLRRNSLIEIALGFTIFAIVGVLGTLHPAIHFL
ncbi:copper homeostasis membrane protein CopD [Bradyrhizobium sp.]|uniref:copper homeostasis membrane protein CopD n=1 Tax=Bradyrhizobium sp. TaxID=376 RepID=UPI003C1BB9D4